MSERGVFYVADTKPYLHEAEISAAQLKDNNPNLSISIATPLSTSYDWDCIVKIQKSPGGFKQKIVSLPHSPYQYTLFLDSDTYVLSNISNLFDLLDKFEMAFTINHNRSAMELDKIPKVFPEYNTGVLLYRNEPKFLEFCNNWAKNFENILQNHNTHDQPAFRQTLYESKLNFVTLPPEWNLMIRYPVHIKGQVKIAHSRLAQFESAGSNTWVDPSKESHKLNLHNGHRLFAPIYGSGVMERFVSPLVGDNKIEKFLFSLRVNGTKYTFARFIYFVLNKFFHNS